LKGVSKTRRLHILTPTEIDDLFSRPQLTDNERTWLFELNQEEQRILVSNRSIAAKVDAIIRLGYFKKTQQFFSLDLHEIPNDIAHVVERYFAPAALDKVAIGRATKLLNQQLILRITGYKLFSQSQHASILSNKAEKLCRLSVNPVFIFQELLAEITQKKITRPGYSTFQKIISSALIAEQKRTSQIFKERLLISERAKLLSLFNQEENFYSVTLLKQQPKNFKPTAVRQEIEYYERYQPLHQIAKHLLPMLEISKNGIEYYASLVEHHTVWSLNHINQDQAYLWLLCFIYHRCQRMFDNLATMFTGLNI